MVFANQAALQRYPELAKAAASAPPESYLAIVHPKYYLDTINSMRTQMAAFEQFVNAVGAGGDFRITHDPKAGMKIVRLSDPQIGK